MDYGKLPPQATDLELAVLGAILLDRNSLYDVIEFLEPEDFYKEDHKLIYSSILSLSAAGKPIDILTVTEDLKAAGKLEGIGGPLYIAQLTNRVASGANVEYHARIIQQKSLRRKMIRVSNEIIKNAYNDEFDVFELIDQSQSEIGAAVESLLTTQTHTAAEVVDKTKKQYLAARLKSGISGIPSGMSRQDQITGGYHPGEVTLMAARPGQGKTAKALSEAATIAKEGIPVAIFSLEMPETQLMQRMLSNVSNVPFDQIRKIQLSPDEWEKHLGPSERAIRSWPLYFVDQGGMTINEVKNRLRRMKRENDIKIAYIDYIQLLRSPGHRNRNEEVGDISRSLKSLAKELEIPIVALAQLSRAVETRGGDKQPILSDLRESGDLEQDADVVMFLMRPEYYGIVEDGAGNSTADACIVSIAKHRNGQTTHFTVNSKLSIMAFRDFEPDAHVADDYNRGSETPDNEPF